MRTDGCGSYKYFAPELCRNDQYDNKIDVWAIGVITYMLVAFRYPFYDPSSSREERTKRRNTKEHIMTGEPNYSQELKNPSPEVMKFLLSCF